MRNVTEPIRAGICSGESCLATFRRSTAYQWDRIQTHSLAYRLLNNMMKIKLKSQH